MPIPDLETSLQSANAKAGRYKRKVQRDWCRRNPEATNAGGAERPQLPPGAWSIARAEQIRAAQERWRGSARRFTGLDVRQSAKIELRHIRLTRSGYQVLIIRGGKKVFSRYFVGFSEESLLAAMRVRDEALRKVPPRRSNPIPPEVLRALGLSSAVVGIFRFPRRSVYRVQYRDAEGKRRLHSSYYRQVPEVDAYAAAIAFRQETLRQKEEGRRKARKDTS